MKKIDPIKELEKRLAGRSQLDLAMELGMSQSYISAVLGGRKPASQRLLDELGIERRITYVKK